MISGDQLRDARGRAGLTQEELGLRVGVSLRSVGNWERGEGVPRAKEALVRDVLGHNLTTGHDAGNPLASFSNLALLNELGRRLESTERREGGSDADAEPRRESPSGGGGDATVRRLTPKQQRFQEQALPQMDVADHPDRDRGPDGRRR